MPLCVSFVIEEDLVYEIAQSARRMILGNAEYFATAEGEVVFYALLDGKLRFNYYSRLALL